MSELITFFKFSKHNLHSFLNKILIKHLNYSIIDSILEISLNYI